MSVPRYRHQQEHEQPDDFKGPCRGKIRYTSLRQARGALRVMQRKYGAPRLEEYRCPNCHGVHLGNHHRAQV